VPAHERALESAEQEHDEATTSMDSDRVEDRNLEQEPENEQNDPGVIIVVSSPLSERIVPGLDRR